MIDKQAGNNEKLDVESESWAQMELFVSKGREQSPESQEGEWLNGPPALLLSKQILQHPSQGPAPRWGRCLSRGAWPPAGVPTGLQHPRTQA